MQKFDYTLDFKTIDLRQQPELDRVGKGEHRFLPLLDEGMSAKAL